MLCHTGTVAAGLAKEQYVNTTAVRHWTCEPRIGEARKPGPLAHFDSEDYDPWSDSDDQLLAEMDCEQDLPPTEQEIATSCMPGTLTG